jgi:uncharacterized paraquat-inducible protein A
MNPIFQLAAILRGKKTQDRKCPKCGHVLKIPARDANATVTCPKCSARVPPPEKR